MRILTILCFALILVTSSPAYATGTAQWQKIAQQAAQSDGYALVLDKDFPTLGITGKDYVLVDARPEYEFNAGHIPGALSFEFDLASSSSLDPQQLTDFTKIAPDKNRTLVFYCRSIR